MTLSEICGGLGEIFHMEQADGLTTIDYRVVTLVAWFTWALEANCIRPTVSLLFPPLFPHPEIRKLPLYN